MKSKYSKFLAPVSAFVKTSMTALCAAMFFSSTALASDLYTTEVVTFKFDAKLLETPEGVEKVLEKMTFKAKSECKADIIYYATFIDTDACVSDLVEQFVEDAGIEVLTKTYKASFDAEYVKLALNID